MISNNIDKESYISFDHVIVLVICIIFFMVFVIQMTIFDYYKKPSIYELELFNEFRRCSDTKKDCESVSEKHTPCGCESENSTSISHHKKSIYDSAIFYKDIIMVIVYLNLMYICSYYVSETMMSVTAIFILSALSYYKFYY